MSEIRVLIIEDEPLIAEDIASSLNALDYTVAGIAYDSEKALDFLVNRTPDVVILDIQIKGTMDGIDIASIIQEKYKIPFLYLTSYSDMDTLERAKKTLPYGYIIKPFSEKDLLSTLEMALYRFRHEHQDVIPDLSALNMRLPNTVSEREYELLLDIYEGLTNQQIAAKHFISINTVKTHLKNLFVKLDVPNRTSAIRLVVKK